MTEANDELVARLERERLGGMPRWQVNRDTPERVARRRAIVLAAEIDDLLDAYPKMTVVRRSA